MSLVLSGLYGPYPKEYWAKGTPNPWILVSGSQILGIPISVSRWHWNSKGQAELESVRWERSSKPMNYSKMYKKAIQLEMKRHTSSIEVDIDKLRPVESPGRELDMDRKQLCEEREKESARFQARKAEILAQKTVL